MNKATLEEMERALLRAIEIKEALAYAADEMHDEDEDIEQFKKLLEIIAGEK